MKELSKEEKDKRKPPKPENLVGALHDKVHKDIKNYRVPNGMRNSIK